MKDLKLSIPFDQYGRYFFISKIIDSNRKTDRPLKILDVGGYEGRLREFLPKDHITILDVFDVKEDCYVKGSGLDIQFPSNNFDVVTSADTLEHIPQDKRELFLSECYRVSKDFMVLAAPFETGKTAEAEDYVNNIYKLLSGHSYIWLKEHKENGLPEPKLIENWARTNRLQYFVLPNNNIEEWKAQITQFFVLDNFPSAKGNKYFQKESMKYNLTSNQYLADLPSYRLVYAISKRGLSTPDLPKKTPLSNSANIESLLKIVKLYIEDQRNQIISNFEFNKVSSELGVIQNIDIEPVKQDDALLGRVANLESELNKITSSISWRMLSKIRSNKIYKMIVSPPVKATRLLLKIYRYKLYFYPPNLIWRLQTKTPPFFKEELGSLSFKVEENPQVSVIVPIYGKATITLDCLKSLAAHSSKYRFEVILVDDKSPDKSKKLFEKVPGLIFLHNSINKGFIYSCNKGSELARGKYIVFLNNDTLVLDNWLDPLIDRLELNKDVGLVGSKLIYPDGTLQEAGGIIFSDGSGWNYGRGEDPDNYEFNYSREVDYCSGASIAISRDLFVKLGMFDARFTPAYYEDTDLAFSVRKNGLRVIYEPRSQIIHKEGASSGTDLSSGTKRYQVINQRKFVKKWATELKENHYISSDYLFYAKDRSSDKNVLIVDHYVPEFDKDSGSVRMTGIIKIMLDLGYRVTLWPQNLYQSHPYTDYFQNLGVQVIYGCVDFKEYSKKYGLYYDVVILSRPSVAPNYIDLVDKYYQNAKIIYDTVDLSFLRIGRLSEINTEPEVAYETAMWKKLELGIMQRVDATLVVSEVEKKILDETLPDNHVTVVSNIHNLRESSVNGFENRKDLLFIGGFRHLPNVDAILWFANSIMPLITKEQPSIKLNIVGSYPPQEILNLSSKNIKVWGYVENVDPLFNKCAVFVAPLRYGAGVKGKVGQAAEYGLPVVSTSIGIEGMHMEDMIDCLVADDEKGYAKAVLKLLADKDLWLKVSNNSRKVIARHFSPAVAKKSLERLLNEL